jgi:hypothetical protein
MRLSRATLLATALLFACGLPDVTGPDAQSVTPPPTQPDPEPTVTPATVALIELSLDTVGAFPGRRRGLRVIARDGRGYRLSSAEAQIAVSDGSVAEVSERGYQWTLEDTVAIKEVWGAIRFLREGTTTVRVSLGGVSQGLTFTVRPEPPLSSALVVDSFTVIEYRSACSWDCPYLLYAPVLRLREPSRSAPVAVIWVEFSVPTQTIQGDVCLGLDAGQAGYLSAIDPYPWVNDYLFAQLDGTPLPDGPATVRLIIRDALGNYGRVEASTTIQRMVENPLFPDPDSVISRWVTAC